MMCRFWILSVGILSIFGCTVLANDPLLNTNQYMQVMLQKWSHMPDANRQLKLSEFKVWVFRNVHRRFVFSSRNLNDLVHQLSRVVAARENDLQSAMYNLLRHLQKPGGVPSEDFRNFVQDFHRHMANFVMEIGAVSSHKIFFPVTTLLDYNGAQAACRVRGGALAVLMNFAEIQKAWQAIATHKHLQFYVGVKSLPEDSGGMYPSMLRLEMTSFRGSNAMCLTINPNTTNQFSLTSCGLLNAALCEKFDLRSIINQVTVKGFVLYRDVESLQQAKETCMSINGSLATIRSASEQREAHAHQRYNSYLDVFIDLVKEPGVGWRWNSTPHAMTYANFGPFLMLPEDRCAEMVCTKRRHYNFVPVSSSSAGKWRPVSCASRNAFLCEVQVIPDSFVRLIDQYATGKYFVAHSDRQTRTRAKSLCGNLATIRSQEQLAAAMLAMSAKRVSRVHIGLSDIRKSGKFVWDDHSRVSEELLDTQLVGFDARKRDHRCVVMDEHGRWLTTSCSERTGYLCEESYRKNPSIVSVHKKPTFEMDVRYSISYKEVTHSWRLKELFIKAAEAPIKKIIGSSNKVFVSSIRRGSTIVTYRVYTSQDGRKDYKKITKAIKKKRVSFYFNGIRIIPTKHQSYNYVAFSTNRKESKFQFHILLIVAGVIGAVFCGTIVKKKNDERNRVLAAASAANATANATNAAANATSATNASQNAQSDSANDANSQNATSDSQNASNISSDVAVSNPTPNVTDVSEPTPAANAPEPEKKPLPDDPLPSYDASPPPYVCFTPPPPYSPPQEPPQ